MKATYIGMISLAVVALMLTGGMSGVVSAAPAPNPIDRIRLETGHTSEWNGGDYVAVNMTKDGSAGWFAVVYGTEANPAPITLVGVTLRYLGGAQVVGPNGNTILDAVPIPIVTVFAQSLFALLEFDDTGIDTLFGSYGTGNGLFDFTSNHTFFFEGAQKFEPLYKYVDMKRAWTLSPIISLTDTVNQSKTFEFSLYATNVSYSKVYDPTIHAVRDGTPEDGVVERIEFRFHIEATAKEVMAEVPFYKVTLDHGRITHSEQIASREYTGVAANTAFKYDHIVEGWDPYPDAVDPHLMLENLLVFGAFIPERVEEWYNVQFLKSHLSDGTGLANYEAEGSNQTVAEQSQLPGHAQLLTKDSISFKNNWERCGMLTWVSNVSVDGTEKQMYYQIHAGVASEFPTDKRDGQVKLLVILGGYIYPMGANIMHDPSFIGEALQIDMNEGLKVLLFVLFVGAAVIVISMLAALVLIRRQNKKGNEKFNHRSPPEYRQP